MDEPGRNDDCPCGSGKKYKRCCLELRRLEDEERASRRAAFEAALSWLEEHHGEALEEEVDAAVLGFMDDGQREQFRELPEAARELVTGFALERLIAGGELAIDGLDISVPELLLGPGGAALGDEGRRWIEALSSHEVSLWRVDAARPGEALVLRDLLDPLASPLTVHERLRARYLGPGEAFLGRVVPWRGRLECTDATLPVEPESIPFLLHGVREALAGEQGEGESAPPEPWVSADALWERWLELIVGPERLPLLFDEASGEPLEHITDIFKVADWGRLEELLDLPEVMRVDSRVWVHTRDGEDLRVHFIGSITEQDHLLVLTQLARTADAERAWLEGVTGGVVTHLERVTSPVEPVPGDPATLLSDLEAAGPASSERVQETYLEVYRTWPEVPLEFLGDFSPREALAHPGFHERVEELLVTYEESEAILARRAGRLPVSFDFLWEELGLGDGRSEETVH